MDLADLERLREIRSRQSMTLKPSPYLRSTFVNDAGEEEPVTIRNYQKVMVMQLLLMDRFINADDTGLGKTLTVLTAIGYVWLQEPEYVPIVIVPKSALFQWEAEAHKFLQGMECVTVHGAPFERHAAYSEFFRGHDPAKKRIVILTYDNVMYDAEESVIREEPRKAKDLRPGFNKELSHAKKLAASAKDAYGREKDVVEDRFAGALLEIQEFVREAGKKDMVSGPFPSGWTSADTDALHRFFQARRDAQAGAARLDSLKEERAPSRRVPGLTAYMQELQAAHPSAKFMLVMDEMHKLKNHKSQFHEKTRTMSLMCSRLVGMTATPVKNRLLEFFSLFRIICPGLFPKITRFQEEFCVMKLQKVSASRWVPILIHYKNLDEFVRRIEPYFMSRKKYDVAKELPQLISVEVECELSEDQDDLYESAEAGLLEEMDDESDTASTLKATVACLQAADAPQLLSNDDGVPYEGESSKLEALVDLLESSEGKKTIIYSKFEKMITLISERLKKEKVKHVRITGKESDPKVRRKHAVEFQDINSGTNVILITSAGAESLNLQAAEDFVFFDLPWSAGDYLQLIGRMIRIGSSHITVTAHHFLARRRDGTSTIDHHVLKALKVKKKLMDKVAGDNLVGAFKFSKEDLVGEILSSMRSQRKSGKCPPAQIGLSKAPLLPTLDDILRSL